MSIVKIHRCLSYTWKSIPKYKVRSRRTFKTCGIVSKNEHANASTTQEAGEFLASVLDSSRTGSIFAGIGQYYQVQEQDRIIVLNFAEDFIADPCVNLFDTQTVLDCTMKDSDVDLFMENVRGVSKLPVYNGEVDFINTSPWQYGFTLKPFSIFSGDERILFMKDDLVTISSLGTADIINVSDVKYVGLWVSDEPYNERKLLLGIKDQPTKTLISMETNDNECDLAALTVSTEWMMKVAALLCVNLTRRGNEDVHLRVAPVLQPANNQWVAMRQKVWIDMIQKNTWETDS